MYLKSLEMVGFKSFAERTSMVFEPGMMAVVGPNGCGKSNVSDAIRWVLGEQSPKALRGGAMTDVIFNGTDQARPLAMAEVSLTLTDCEAVLGIEYHEVTITRRVFRSGEGQYFINRAPCRLKDIQRLFMDTGIGTNSYSVLEQGHIDQILSARAEDRREVFEEASGISRFKADRREALRKLEHTDANLLRLGDILKEVKRQIISLQRQVGKAKRYKALQERLLTLDGWLGHLKLQEFDTAIGELEARLKELHTQEETLRVEVEGAEQKADAIRTILTQIETKIAAALDAASQSGSALTRAKELIRVNQERAAELEELASRDTKETESAQTALILNREHLTTLSAEQKQIESEHASAAEEMAKLQKALAEHESATQQVRNRLQNLRSESVTLENTLARLQEEWNDLEARSRNDMLRKERLSSEQAEAQRAVSGFAERLEQLKEESANLRNAAQEAADALSAKDAARTERAAELAGLNREAARLTSEIAAREAKVDLLAKNRAEARGFPAGAQKLLDGGDAAAVLGALATKIRTDKKHERALETALRAWLDAIVVQSGTDALSLAKDLLAGGSGSARLLPMDAPESAATPDGEGVPLLSKVKADADLAPLLSRLLGRVRVVANAAAIPARAPDGPDYVTLDGLIARANGIVEVWLPAADESNPLALEHQLAEWQEEIQSLRAEADATAAKIKTLQDAEAGEAQEIAALRTRLEERRREAAHAEGGIQMVERESAQAAKRLEDLAKELEVISKKTSGGEAKREELSAKMAQTRERQTAIRTETGVATEDLRKLEDERNTRVDAATESRVATLSLKQKLEGIAMRAAPMEARIRELEELIRGRTAGVAVYQERKEALQKETAAAEAAIPSLEEETAKQQQALAEARAQRDEQRDKLANSDGAFHAIRTQYDSIRDKRSAADLELERNRMQRQHMLDRLESDYQLPPEEVLRAVEPEWEEEIGEQPSRDVIETMVSELRGKIQSMGPVNLVAIEENQELEERYAFLSQQNEDLLAAKEKLLALIKEINETTTSLFTETFAKVNENFQELFTRLFGGGTARLSLLDSENVLESGIDIIAKPPGKKLQSVSLLSGGERTLTALALLFALFKVKPSPFCLTDELDAPLDDSNISRYLDILRSFLDSTQFIVITHNWQTISAAKALYGVTMERRGISKVVSVKFSDAIEQAKTEQTKSKARGKAAAKSKA